MLDIKLIRDNPGAIEEQLKTKDPSVDLKPLVEIDEQIRALKTNVEQLKSERNDLSKKIGERKRAQEDASELLEKVGGFGEQIEQCDKKLKELELKFDAYALHLPNLPFDDIKRSSNPEDNVCVKEHGKVPSFSFPIQHHLEIGENLGLFDLDRGAKMSGAGWPIYKGLGAQLEWALINLMLEYHIERGYTQWMLPLLVRSDMMKASGQFPKFKDQMYTIDDPQHDLYMLPTAEVALNALHYDDIIPIEELPKRYVAFTPCFRREAGAAGKNERGLIRTHQFNKVEMFSFCTPDQSESLFREFVEGAEAILEMLELPYKRMELVTGDMSFSGAKTIDVEVYLPGQERFMEVSSISLCTDFQARRSKTRFREKGSKPQLVHTLNGSGLATSRVMVALLENHQQEDGSVLIPKGLQKYFGSRERLT